MILGNIHKKLCGKAFQEKDAAMTGSEQEGQCDYSMWCKGKRIEKGEWGGRRN